MKPLVSSGSKSCVSSFPSTSVSHRMPSSVTSTAFVFIRPNVATLSTGRFRICSHAKVSAIQNKLHPSSQKELTVAVDSFRNVANRVGLSAAQQNMLLKVSEMLHETNSHYNLTGIRTRHEIIEKHLIDGMTLLPVLDKETPKTVVDVGTGAGFPGLVLAVSRPEWSLTLVDSVRKKLAFHRQVVDELSLDNVQSEWGRAEELAQGPLREKFCVAVARSVAEMRVLAELTLPFIRVGGCVIAQKSVDSQLEEISAARNSVKVCGGRFEQALTAWPSDWRELLDRGEELDKDLDAKRIVLVRKERPTPPRYPRRPGTPKKFPL